MMLALLTLIACGPIVPAAQTTSPRPPPPAADRKPGDYPLGPDSLPQDGVPKGKLEGPFLFRSQVIANTVRRYWIYVPAQYTGDRPANVLVFQDGQRATNPTGSLRVHQVLENLIHKKDIPVTIGIFITPGQRGDTYPDNLGTGNPNNRAAGVRLVERRLRAVHRGRDAAGGGEELQADGRSRGPRDRRHEQRRDLRLHRRVARARSVPQRHQHDRQLHVDRLPSVAATASRWCPAAISIRPSSARTRSSRSRSSCRTVRPISTTSTATGSSPTSRCSRRSSSRTRPRTRRQLPGPRYQVKHEWGDGAHSDAHGGSLLPDILRWIWGEGK